VPVLSLGAALRLRRFGCPWMVPVTLPIDGDDPLGAEFPDVTLQNVGLDL
jgi:hypothetical protein